MTKGYKMINNTNTEAPAEALAEDFDLIRATCLSCHKVTTEPRAIEIMNDYDPVCTFCNINAVRWDRANGSAVITGENEEGEEYRHELAALGE